MIRNKTIYSVVISLLICSISGSYEITIMNPAPFNPKEVAGTAVLRDGSRGCIMFASLSQDPTPVTIVGLAGPLPGAKIAWIKCFDIDDDGDETTKYAELKEHQELYIELLGQGYVSVITFVREAPPEYLSVKAIEVTGMSAGGKFLAWIELELHNILKEDCLTKTKFAETKVCLNAIYEEFKDHPEWIIRQPCHLNYGRHTFYTPSLVPILNLIQKKTPRWKKFFSFICINLDEYTFSPQEIQLLEELKATLNLSAMSYKEMIEVIAIRGFIRPSPEATPQQALLKYIEKEILQSFRETFSIDRQSLQTAAIVREYGSSITNIDRKIRCVGDMELTLSNFEMLFRLILANGFENPVHPITDKIYFSTPHISTLTDIEQALAQQIKIKYELESLSDDEFLQLLFPNVPRENNVQAIDIILRAIRVQTNIPHEVLSKLLDLASRLNIWDMLGIGNVFARQLQKWCESLSSEDVVSFDPNEDDHRITFFVTDEAYKLLMVYLGLKSYLGYSCLIRFKPVEPARRVEPSRTI